jgi:CRP-like cAMP-binding protein
MSFIKKFIELYSSSASKDFVEKLTNILKTTSYKKNESIVKLGDNSSKFYILKEGIVRSYIIGPKGKEHIKILHKGICVFAPLTDLIKKQPSTLIFDCLTDCEILEGNFYELFTPKNLNLEFSSFYIKVLERIYTTSENKIYDLSILNATERYIKLRREIPNIENLIQQYHIASYLNITPTQLSRIRKEYYSK